MAKAKPKRYILFHWFNYASLGGANDMSGRSDSLARLKRKRERQDRVLCGSGSGGWDQWHILDTATGKIVAEGDTDGEG